MVSVQNMHFSYSGKPVFTNVSFTLGEQMITGLVGPNGAGKSTLFKLLINQLTPSDGKIEITGSVGYVPQEIKRDTEMENSQTVFSYVDPSKSLEEHEIKRMLSGLEMGEVNLSDNPNSFSGGQKTKLALLRSLIQKPDVLLLDEPTNFLDSKGKEWVMHFLSTYPHTVFLVSHDLGLLDAKIKKVLAINPETNSIEEYKGNYTAFQKLKKERDEQLKRYITNEQKHIKQMEKGVERMARYTSEKGVRARTNLKRRIERIKTSLPPLPKEAAGIKISLPSPSWSGELPIRAIAISKSYDGTSVLQDVSLSIRRGEKIALIGPNGAGKSTFIKLLMGFISPDSGTVEKDKNLSIGYYSQEFEQFDLSKTLFDTVQEQTEWDEGRVRPFLASFLFSKEQVKQKVETLSGGEKTRLFVGLLMLKSHNLLILDEPTTYLDVLSQRIILETLKKYEGTMLVVSHTEDFVKELKPTRALLLPENRVEFWSDELLERVGEI